MRQQLKRIEATLEQLANQGVSARSIQAFPKTGASSRNASLASLLDQPSDQQDSSYQSDFSVSFSVAASSPPSAEFGDVVQPFSVDQEQTKLPMLPKFKSLSFTSHRNGANPALAMNLLHEIETIVQGWQTELHSVLLKIQELYLEGPIVDGWLESQSQVEATVSPLRHVEVNHLMDYVEQMCDPSKVMANSNPHAGYRLCGLNADGQPWCRPCPPDQVPSVSLAIARYHKLRQLLTRKQELETRLSQLAETLIVLHGHLQ
jgi:hypothetical protein